ncbi:MAG TPA: nuclear transport factor 2 family protein [Candidatus Limnocylindrales bacterium]|nr:nuclear transport factor 2 family protein [Candidatus Limnocylindrales bacterium]
MAESISPGDLRALERRRTKALVDHDMELARALHADDYELVTPGGVTYDKATYLGEIESGELTYHVFEPASEIAVRINGDAAAVRYRARIVIDFEGGSDDTIAWHTDLYERRDGRWQATWSQATQTRGAT